MQQYKNLVMNTLQYVNTPKQNRTGIDHIGYHGEMMKFDLRDGFPILTTKRMPFKSIVAEMLGFLRGYNNAADFRNLGCNVWNANANENKTWLNNQYREGEDDLGRIYGVQARNWRSDGLVDGEYQEPIDQLKIVIEKLLNKIDDRRLIVTHWNPGELNQMALPPCHLLYQFGIQGDFLNLTMYQRSCDVPLGIPFNITGYAWLLSVIAHITGYKPAVFTHFMHDVHVYVNQIEIIKEQMERECKPLPKLVISDHIFSLEDLETWVMPYDFQLENYDPHPHIKIPFAV